ncbi:NIPSNAP family protein [Plantactinospora sp. GCM10030261]|uniref:NIPSNAP family protein n=1 Tax=Plantactinospora sp. GCM10030261 TaxID=3273420 RepID=UPI003620DD7A
MRESGDSPAGGLAGCAVVEMRRYLLRPGGFDDLRRLFQRWLVDGQEQAGMRLGGQFRDRDNPDRFVWFRGFESMVQRHEALEAFYLGPVWRTHRDAANATMIDSDDVLLLRPTDPAHPPTDPVSLGGPGTTASTTWAVAQVWSWTTGDDPESTLAGLGHEVLRQRLGVPVAMWRTEPSPNTFPWLPVRDGRHVVWLAVFPDAEHWLDAATRLARDERWRRITGRLAAAGATDELLHLQPTATSRHPRPAGGPAGWQDIAP